MIVRFTFITMFLLVNFNIYAQNISTNDETAEWKLIWSDEFEEDGLPNENNWNYEVGDACNLPMGCGWGNKELQYYTEKREKNARTSDGHLIIEAHQEKMHNSDYTSARLTTKNKADFKFGKIEVRAKLASGRGSWSAIWMFPTHEKYGHWPRSGEIDIMEYVGFAKDTIYGTTHTQAFNGMIQTQKEGKIYFPGTEEQFHTYSIEWTEDQIKWFVDDIHYHTFEKLGENADLWPFDQEFHLIINVAVGGNWGGRHGVDSEIWPQKMLIDYVRIYEKL